MATTVTSVTPGTGGFVSVKYSDGTTKSMPASEAPAVGSTVVAPGSYGSSGTSANPFAGATGQGDGKTVTINGQATPISTILAHDTNDPARLAAIRNQLLANKLISKTAKPSDVINEYTKVLYNASLANTDPNTWMTKYSSGLAAGTTGTTATKRLAVGLNGKPIDVTALKGSFDLQSQAVQDQVRQFATSQGKRIGDAKTIWGQLVEASASAYAQGKQLSPIDIIQQQLSGQTKPETYTSTTKQNYTPENQAANINKTFQAYIGRLASQDEINSIVAQANQQPGTQTATTYAAGGVSSQTTQDLTPEQIAQQQLLSAQQYQPERQRMQNLSFASWLDTAMRGGTQATAGLTNG